jgi:S1-C subfamily serine protease
MSVARMNTFGGHNARLCGWITVATFSLACSAAGQQPNDNGPAVYASEAPGVMLIRAAGVKADGSMTAEVGTGFAISQSGYVLTASHVIPEGAQYKTFIIGGTFGPATVDGKPYQLELVKRSDKYDVALLHIVAPPHDLTVLRMRKSPPKPGEMLFVLGYPLGLPDTHFLDGRVSDATTDAITTNALVDRGNSGGPVLDTRGCVIGIVFGEISKSEGQPVNGVKFAVPTISLGEFLPNDLGPSQGAQQGVQGVDVIHVSDTLSRIQTDHDLTSDTVRSYHDVIAARSGFSIEAVEAVGHNSLNPPSLQFPTPVISPDRRSMSFDYNLLSGPVFDQRRGWIDMTVNTRQRRVGAPIASPPSNCE